MAKTRRETREENQAEEARQLDVMVRLDVQLTEAHSNTCYLDALASVASESNGEREPANSLETPVSASNGDLTTSGLTTQAQPWRQSFATFSSHRASWLRSTRPTHVVVPRKDTSWDVVTDAPGYTNSSSDVEMASMLMALRGDEYGGEGEKRSSAGQLQATSAGYLSQERSTSNATGVKKHPRNDYGNEGEIRISPRIDHVEMISRQRGVMRQMPTNLAASKNLDMVDPDETDDDLELTNGPQTASPHLRNERSSPGESEGPPQKKRRQGADLEISGLPSDIAEDQKSPVKAMIENGLRENEKFRQLRAIGQWTPYTELINDSATLLHFPYSSPKKKDLQVPTSTRPQAPQQAPKQARSMSYFTATAAQTERVAKFEPEEPATKPALQAFTIWGRYQAQAANSFSASIKYMAVPATGFMVAKKSRFQSVQAQANHGQNTQQAGEQISAEGLRDGLPISSSLSQHVQSSSNTAEDRNQDTSEVGQAVRTYMRQCIDGAIKERHGHARDGTSRPQPLQQQQFGALNSGVFDTREYASHQSSEQQRTFGRIPYLGQERTNEPSRKVAETTGHKQQLRKNADRLQGGNGAVMTSMDKLRQNFEKLENKAVDTATGNWRPPKL